MIKKNVHSKIINVFVIVLKIWIAIKLLKLNNAINLIIVYIYRNKINANGNSVKIYHRIIVMVRL